MPTVSYKTTEIMNMVNDNVEELSDNFATCISNSQKSGIRHSIDWIHIDSDGKESRSNADFDPYKSFVRVTFSERY